MEYISKDPIIIELKALHEARKAAFQERLKKDKDRLVSFLESALDPKKYDFPAIKEKILTNARETLSYPINHYKDSSIARKFYHIFSVNISPLYDCSTGLFEYKDKLYEYEFNGSKRTSRNEVLFTQFLWTLEPVETFWEHLRSEFLDGDISANIHTDIRGEEAIVISILYDYSKMDNIPITRPMT